LLARVETLTVFVVLAGMTHSSAAIAALAIVRNETIKTEIRSPV